MGLSPEIDVALAGLVGLMLGSFLNVVIHRLPKMMERQWEAEFAAMAAEKAAPAGSPPAEPAPVEAFNLMVPRSRCPHCSHAIHWYENLPVVSWLVLRGRCSACKARISARYPLVELATGALFAYCVWRWGITPTAGAWCVFSAALVTLAMIDWDTTLLPDDITYPLLWTGLVAALMQWTGVPLGDAVWGAVGGYLSLWSVYWAFKLATGKEGMGYGDFKLFAALGAWFGWQALVPLILVSSIVGAVVGIAMKLNSRLREGGYVPFGPFLAAAGLSGMAFGPEWALRLLGF